MGKLDGKVALITGAGSGIGRATALLFAREGAKIAVADYVPAGGQETVGMIKEAGGDAIFVETDVSKSAEVQKMVKATLDKYGRIDILYNNAGIGPGVATRTADFSEEDWDRFIAINLKGVFLGSKYTIPVMLKQGGGVIINTSSLAGLTGASGAPGYCASKGGVVLLTKTMALDYARQNIRVNCICPGPVLTSMIAPMMPDDPVARQAVIQSLSPMGKVGLPEEIAQTALYLASSDSSFVTGQAIAVDGGYMAGMQTAPPAE